MTLREALSNSFEDNFSIRIQENEDAPVVTWYEGEHIIQYVNERWGLRELVFDASMGLPQAQLAFSFNSYFNNPQQVLNNARIRTALLSEYNPLNNYEGKEVRVLSTIHKGTGGADKKYSDTSDVKGTVSNYNKMVNTSDTLPNLTETLAKAGFNNTANPAVDTITTKTGTENVKGTSNVYNNEATQSLTQNKGTSESKTTDNYSHGERETITKGGNLGVTTSQQMILSEINLRTNDWLIKWLEKWVNSITYYKVSDNWGYNEGVEYGRRSLYNF